MEGQLVKWLHQAVSSSQENCACEAPGRRVEIDQTEH